MKWNTFALLMCLVVGFSLTAHAVPSISQINGDISHGQTITIQGSGFGSKSNPEPMIFETVESGDFSSEWASEYNLLPNNDNNRHANSQYNGHLDFRGGHRHGKFEGPGAVHQKWFVQYWFKISENWDWGNTGYDGNNRFLSNIKAFRMWSPAPNLNENFVLTMAGWTNDIEYTVEHVASNNGGYMMNGYKEMMTKDEWHLFQFEYLENTSPGQADGQFRAWFDGELVKEDNALLTREDFSNLKRPFIIGWSAVWSANGELGESHESPNDFYIDDVYMDNTWARVEIGDHEIYANCTHREIQSPLQWNNGQIQLRVNSGSFVEDDTAYLFVTDANGNRNPQGIEITIGESGGVIDPPDPNPDPEIKFVWDATEQAGSPNWLDSSVTYTVRLLIQPEFINESGDQIKLAFQPRSSGNYSIKKVSIAERDQNAPEGDVIDETWTQVPFDGVQLSQWETTNINVSQGEIKFSDFFDFELDSDKEYYVTFKINTPSVYLEVPETYRELYFFDEDRAGDIDWSGNGHAVTRDYHALFGIFISSPHNQAPVADAGPDNVVTNIIGDGFVDGSDFNIRQRHFGSREGDPNWNPCADMNSNGIVDAADHTVWRNNYGGVNGGVADINGCLDEPITLDASRSTDPDNNIVRFRWVDTCQGTVELLYDGPEPVVNNVLIKGIGIHNIVLTVFDSDGNSSDDALIVELRDQTQNSSPPDPPTLILPDPGKLEKPVLGAPAAGVTRFNASRGEVGKFSLSLDKQESVSIKIINRRGRIVRNFVSRVYGKGNHIIPWDGFDDLGRRVASGAYNVLCIVGDTLHKLKMVVLN